MQPRTLYDYWLVLYRGRGIIALTVLSAVATAYFVSKRLPPIYEAVSEFYVAPSQPTTSFFASTDAAATAVRNLVMPTITKELEASYVGLLDSEAIRKRVHSRVSEKPFIQLAKDVDVKSTREHLLQVRVLDRSADIAARIANAYPWALNDFLTQVSVQRQQRTIMAMQSSLAQTETHLTRARHELQAFRVQVKIPDVNQEVANIMARQAELQAELEKARGRLKGVTSRTRVVGEQLQREAKRDAEVFVESETVIHSSTTRKLMQEMSALQKEIATVRAKSSDHSVAADESVQDLLRRLDQKKRELLNTAEDVRKRQVSDPVSFYEQLRRELVSLYVERAALEAEVTTSTNVLDELTRKVVKLPSQRLKGEELQSEVRRLEQMRDTLAVRYQEMQAQLINEQDLVVIVKEAELAREARFPSPLVDALVAALLGLIGGMYLTFLYEYVLRVRERRGIW